MTTVPSDLINAFPKRPANLHKYSAGTVTVVGGSAHYIHAPVIAGLGARSGGAGLVQLVVPDASRIAAANLVPEATFTKLITTCAIPKADVTVCGMGLGLTSNAEVIVSKLLSGSAGRFVLDADALSLLAKWYAGKSTGYMPGPDQTLVITPHEGEAAKMLACSHDEISKSRIIAARRLAATYHAVVVLKGMNTIVARPDNDDIWTCSAGNPFMALGGMGDLLAGVLAARWAFISKSGIGEKPLDQAFAAARSAVWLHAAAADDLVARTPPVEPCIVETARSIASVRIELERN